MSIQLTLDSVLAAASAVNERFTANMRAQILDTVDALCDMIGDHYSVRHNMPDNWDNTISGMCRFSPSSPDQPCPPELRSFDPDGDWVMLDENFRRDSQPDVG